MAEARTRTQLVPTPTQHQNTNRMRREIPHLAVIHNCRPRLIREIRQPLHKLLKRSRNFFRRHALRKTPESMLPSFSSSSSAQTQTAAPARPCCRLCSGRGVLPDPIRPRRRCTARALELKPSASNPQLQPQPHQPAPRPPPASQTTPHLPPHPLHAPPRPPRPNHPHPALSLSPPSSQALGSATHRLSAERSSASEVSILLLLENVGHEGFGGALQFLGSSAKPVTTAPSRPRLRYYEYTSTVPVVLVVVPRSMKY